MDSDGCRTFWRVLRPSKWPEAPFWMSYTTLVNLEACPRRWALCCAEYPEAWGSRGYPRSPQAAALEGTVVHLSLQKLTSALVRNGRPSPSDEATVSVLKELGGFTHVVLGSLEQALRAYDGNPRAAPILDGLRPRLMARVPELRSRVQRFLTRMRPAGFADGTGRIGVQPGSDSRRPLSHGSYAELDLRSNDMGWRGYADLLTVSPDRCEIRDYKTGAPKEEHGLQLRTYALLWSLDRDLNPTGRRVDRLVISYDDGDSEVPAPNEGELRSLEEELRKRTMKVLTDLRAVPPEARPSSENCVYCPVRHLCDEYWLWYSKASELGNVTTTRFGDVEATLVSQHGPSSWDGVLEFGPHLGGGMPMMLRLGCDLPELHRNQRLRLLNVHISVPEENVTGEPRTDTTVVVSMGVNSESFVLAT